MKINKIGRVLVCLVLICALVVNISPIKAHATGLVEGIAVAPLPVSVKVVAAAALICLGIMAVSESNAFDNAVDNFAKFLSETTSYVVDGMVNVFGVVGSDGFVRSYLPVELLESGLCWAFDSGIVVSSGPSFALSKTYNLFGTDVIFNSNNTVPFDVCIFYTPLTDGTKCNFQIYCFGESKFNVNCYNFNYTSYDFGYYWGTSVQSGYGASLTSLLSSDCMKFQIADSSEINAILGAAIDTVLTSDGLTLGRIQAPGDEVAFGDLEAYSAYAGGAISLPGVADEEEKLHLPVRIPGLEYTDDVTTQTQEEAQTGVTDLEFVFTGDDTVTDGAATNPGTITSGIKDFFDFAPEDLVLPASLTDLFPFCIPKDIYDLVTVFNAEPEAPHFVFDVPFPYMEEPWHIDIDFAVWDSVALVLRRLELLLFVVGLAMATRNYYIRG